MKHPLRLRKHSYNEQNTPFTHVWELHWRINLGQFALFVLRESPDVAQIQWCEQSVPFPAGCSQWGRWHPNMCHTQYYSTQREALTAWERLKKDPTPFLMKHRL